VLAALLTITVCGEVLALSFSENPERSFFVGIDLGAGLDLARDARTPYDPLAVGSPEAYAVSAFLFGIDVGGRFDEVFGLEVGWHQQRHDAEREWGSAYYGLGHVALRLAVPTATRQTPVFLVGPAIGPFFYGTADPYMEEDNGTLVLGGLAGARIEHELVLGVVATFTAAYLPLWRFGMDGQLSLVEHYSDGSSQEIGRKDFTEGQLIHVLWLSLGIQFEWTFR
jgi:hypothetical protein